MTMASNKARTNASRFKREKIWYDFTHPLVTQLEAMSRETLTTPTGFHYPKYYFTMHELEKIGIRPRASYITTPMAVYGYPLNPDYLKQLLKGTLPYRANAKHVTILELADPDHALVLRPYYLAKDSKEENEGFAMIGLYQKIKREALKRHYDRTHQHPERPILKTAIVAMTNALLKESITAVVDLGTSSIHPNEPDQVAFLSPSAYRVVETLQTKGRRPDLSKIPRGQEDWDQARLEPIVAKLDLTGDQAIDEAARSIMHLMRSEKTGEFSNVRNARTLTELVLMSIFSPQRFERIQREIDVEEYVLYNQFLNSRGSARHAMAAPRHYAQFPFEFDSLSQARQFQDVLENLPGRRSGSAGWPIALSPTESLTFDQLYGSSIALKARNMGEYAHDVFEKEKYNPESVPDLYDVRHLIDHWFQKQLTYIDTFAPVTRQEATALVQLFHAILLMKLWNTPGVRRSVDSDREMTLDIYQQSLINIVEAALPVHVSYLESLASYKNEYH